MKCPGLHPRARWGHLPNVGARAANGEWRSSRPPALRGDVGDYRGNTDVYTVGPDGGGLTKLTQGHRIGGSFRIPTGSQFDGFYDPVWSPDGTKVLLGRQFADPEGSFREGLSMINADGSGLDWVAPEVYVEHQPDWGTAPLH